MCKSRLFRCCLVALSLIGLPAFAQTPDGQTPAKDTACDVVKGSKGLYGLCVAFCEAQDLDESTTRKSRDKILDNYKKLSKKINGAADVPPCFPPATEADPQPSSGTQPTCPCWTAAQADAIDGVLSDGSTAEGWPAPSSDLSACSVTPYLYIMEKNASQSEFSLIETFESPSHTCVYGTRPNGTLTVVNLSVEAGMLTAEEFAACQADILARQAALDLCQLSP